MLEPFLFILFLRYLRPASKRMLPPLLLSIKLSGCKVEEEPIGVSSQSMESVDRADDGRDDLISSSSFLIGFLDVLVVSSFLIVLSNAVANTAKTKSIF